jgi:hypothetical protein
MASGPEYNLALSQRRALAVRDYLVSQQVPADELIAKGYGKTEPIATNTTPAGRSMNRRVVLIVLATRAPCRCWARARRPRRTDLRVLLTGRLR